MADGLKKRSCATIPCQTAHNAQAGINSPPFAA
jgi:hypothetical protein